MVTDETECVQCMLVTKHSPKCLGKLQQYLQTFSVINVRTQRRH